MSPRPAASPAVSSGRSPVYTGEQVREAEAPLIQAGEGPALMRRAAHGLAQHVLAVLSGAAVSPATGHSRPGARGTRAYGARVTGLIGSGNNGGDGLYALAQLRRRGVDATAVLIHDRCHYQALAAFLHAGGRILDHVPPRTEVLIDAMLGTGAREGFIRPQVPGLDTVLAQRQSPEHVEAGQSGLTVVACDLPSGVHATTGRANDQVIPADSTVTFGGIKQGLLVGAGAQLSGRVTVVDIGLAPHLPPTVVTATADSCHPSAYGDSAAVYSHDDAGSGPEVTAHKYSRGVVQIMAGSEQFPGAAQLTTGAAVHSGVGMVMLHAPAGVRQSVIDRFPEVVPVHGSGGDPLAGRATSVVIGPGLGEQHSTLLDAEYLLDAAIAQGVPCVLDASGLALVRRRVGRCGTTLTSGESVLGPHVLITPHLGEARALARALRDPVMLNMLTPGAAQEDPVEASRRLAGRLDCTVLLKGPATVIASPEADVVIHRSSAPGLATAGSGDVLAGILGAVAAVRLQSWLDAAAVAVRRHTAAAAGLDPQGLGRFGASALWEELR